MTNKVKMIRPTSDCWTPKQMLEKVLDDINSGEAKFKNAILILHNDNEDGTFDLRTLIAGFDKTSDTILWLEYLKADFLREMQT